MKCPLCSTAEHRRFAPMTEGREYWLCATCKLVWLDESQRPSVAAEEARYRTHQNSGAEYLSYLRKTALPVAERVRAGSRGLDYGCGPSKGMEQVLSPMGFTVDSYDPIFFPQFDLLKNRYEFLLCSEAAEHFFHPAAEFARLKELLLPGGVIGVSSRLCVSEEEFPQWSYRRDPTHVVFYNTETVHWIANHFAWTVEWLESPLWVLRG